MVTLTSSLGAVLVVLGLVAYVASDAASLTALIPTAVGLLLAICGVLARREATRMHAIHAAMLIALLGALGSLMQVFQLGDLVAGDAERPAAVVVGTAMFVLLIGYLVLGVRSFRAARRARTG